MRVRLIVLLVLLGLAGCSDDPSSAPTTSGEPTSPSPSASDESSAPASTTTTPTRQPPLVTRGEARAARRTFETWLGAFARGDGARACPLQTHRFTQQQVERLARDDRIDPGATCTDLVTIAGYFFDTMQLDIGDAEVTRAPVGGERVAFSVRFEDFAALGYSLIHTRHGWRVDEDLTSA